MVYLLTMQGVFYLPPLGTNAPTDHGFTTMSCRVETSKPLFQCMWSIGYRRDNHLPAFHRDPNPLVDAEISLTGDSCGYTDTQIIAPLLDVEDGLCHDLHLEKCLNVSLDTHVPLVNAIVGCKSVQFTFIQQQFISML